MAFEYEETYLNNIDHLRFVLPRLAGHQLISWNDEYSSS